MERIKPDNKYLNNGYFYLTCNCCDRVILNSEMNEEEFNNNNGYCLDCYKLERYDSENEISIIQ